MENRKRKGGMEMKEWKAPEVLGEFLLEELEYNMLLGDWTQAWTWNHALSG